MDQFDDRQMLIELMLKLSVDQDMGVGVGRGLTNHSEAQLEPSLCGLPIDCNLL